MKFLKRTLLLSSILLSSVIELNDIGLDEVLASKVSVEFNYPDNTEIPFEH